MLQPLVLRKPGDRGPLYVVRSRQTLTLTVTQGEPPAPAVSRDMTARSSVPEASSAPGPTAPCVAQTRASTGGVALVRRFLPYLRPHYVRLALTLTATVARPTLNAGKVWLLKVLIDDVLRARQPSLLLAVCAGYIAISLGKGLASFADDYLGGWVGAHVVQQLRIELYDRLQGLSLHFYHRQRLGDLLTRITGDIGAIEDFVVLGTTDLLAHGLTVLVFLGMLLYLDVSLAWVALAALPALLLVSIRYARRTRATQAEIRERASAVTSVAEEGLSAIALVKAFAREPFERERFGEAARASSLARLRMIRLRARFTPLVDLLATLGAVLVVWFGAQAVLAGQLSLGGLVVFLGYVGSLYSPIQGLTRLGGLLQRALVSAERVAEVLDVEPGARERRLPHQLTAVRGVVEFRDVCFGYSPERSVLRGFSLTIQPGEMVALVGASGAGKTTVVSLLLAYYDAEAGAITIDGQDLRAFDPPSIRRQIAAVLQEPMLFQSSVRENIRYGRLSASAAQAEEAARTAEADAFISALPEGYDTLVGPRGARLSGGQRQRLALARALLKNAPIVILDEATAALDAFTEAHVLDRLRERLVGQSVLVVAHRLSTVRRADRIAVLENGQVVEIGTHRDLLARGGPYARLYATHDHFM